MNAIGFKNFRRFVEFPKIQLNEITLMVGKNNSGKSTLVKALLLVIDYLKYQQNQTFSFSSGNIIDTNIVSFDRAKCRFQNEDVIYFDTEIANYHINIKVSGDEQSISGIIDEITIEDTMRNLKFCFNHSSKQIEVSKKRNILHDKIPTNTLRSINEIDYEIKALSQKELNVEILNDIDKLNREKIIIEKTIHQINNEPQNNFLFTVKYEVELNRNPSNNNFFDFVLEFLNENENEKKSLINKREKEELSEKQNEQLEEINQILSSASELKDSIEGLIQHLDSHYYYYWSAETQKQSALFSIRDKQNSLANAIHDFSSYRIMKGDRAYEFVENQMNEFEIGVSFQLISHAGEAYECNIIDENGHSVSLADKGMGSIQLMTLFFRLATIIQQQIIHKEYITLIIEEPELNLHPKLQSKLADLIYTLNKSYSVRFIIETHSEYLIRRTQVIVANENYKDLKDVEDNNGFRVYYFPNDKVPYNMGYQTKGKFLNDFELGFFNVADDSAIELFELNN